MGKRLQLKVVWGIAITAILLVCFKNDGFSQSNQKSQSNTTTDSNTVKKPNQTFSKLFKILFHKSDKSTAAKANKKGKQKSDTSNRNNHPEPVEFTQGGLTWTSLYTKGVNLNTGIGGLYSLGRLTQGLDIYGIPLTGEATGVFNNGQYEKSYSSYSVNFDARTYLNGMKRRAENIMLNKRALEQPSGRKQNLADSLSEYENVRKLLTSPSYQSDENMCRKKLKKEDDSAKNNPNADTTELHSLRKKMAYYKKMEERYHQLFEIKKNYNRLLAADTSDKRSERKYSGDEKSLNNSENVEKILSENHDLKGYEKAMMGLQKFSIGQSGEEISEFTLHNFMLNGLNAGYKAGDIYSNIGYGKQIAVVNPYLMTGIAIPEYNRTVVFVRTGLGSETNSNIYVTVIKISDPGNSSTLGENNWIFDISKKIVVSKNLEFEGELAKSSFNYIVPVSTDNSLIAINQTGNDIAYALRAKGAIPATNTILKVEYGQTGQNYITLGNPYLLSGAGIYRAEVSQPLGNKFFVTVGGEHIVQNQSGVKSTDNWLDFSLRFKPTRLITMELKYAPRQLEQEEGTVVANSTISNINQISFTGNMTNRIGSNDANTTVFIGNFQYATQESSLLLTQNTNLSYYMANELFMLSPTNGITISADESRSNWTGGLSQFIGQATYTMNVKKTLTLGLGPQWVQQPGIISNGGGLVSSLSETLKKWGRIGVQLNYRNNLEKPFGDGAQWLISGNISVLW